VKQDLSFSKKGKVVVLYALARLVFIQFENNRDMNQFLKMISSIIHTRDNMPLYIVKNPVSQPAASFSFFFSLAHPPSTRTKPSSKTSNPKTSMLSTNKPTSSNERKNKA
jgi:hypothetical protein